MQEQRLTLTKLSSILLLIAILLSVSTISYVDHVSNKETKSAIAEHGSSGKSNEAFIKNVTFEAVIPFIHLDLLQHYIVAPSWAFSFFTVQFWDFSTPVYINKYLKNLFLFIISPNAP